MQASTHDLTIGMSDVSKRFTSWQRGEADREWEALRVLADRAPGLAPRPLRRTVDAGRPVIVMSRLPGMPLGNRPLTRPQVMAVADAMTELHRAVPVAEFSQFPRRIWHPAEAVETLRAWSIEHPPNLRGNVRHAFIVGAEWIHSTEASRVAFADEDQVLGQGDGNIANFLWDGERCRLVDFEDCGISDRAFEIADLVEHLSTSLCGLLVAEDLLQLLVSDPDVVQRVLEARRVLAFYWLNMLLPGKPAHRRNPPDSCERQARRLLQMLA